MKKTNNITTTTLLRMVLLLLLMVGANGAWGEIAFQAVNRMINNGDGTFTTAPNAGNQYALAIADLSEIAGITTMETVKVEFDCNIPTGSRWWIGIGDKNKRGTNANGSSSSSYTQTGIMHLFGSGSSGSRNDYYRSFAGGCGHDYGTNGSSSYYEAFGKTIHATFIFNRTSSTYSYSLTDGTTTYFTASNRSTSVANLTIIEAYSWQNSSTITLSNVKVNDDFYFPKGEDVMYMEDMVYQSPLVNATGLDVTYSITGNNGYVRTETNISPYFPFYPIKTSGDNAITITASATGHSSSYNLKVGTRNNISASSLVIGETFDVGYAVGTIIDENVTIGTGLTLHFGSDTEPQVIRNDGNNAVVCIDANGYTHTYWDENWNKEIEPTMGTYFKLDVIEPKTLVVDGYFTAPTDEPVLLRRWNGSSMETAVMSIANPSNGSLARGKVDLTETGTYYLYSQTGTFSLKSLTYTNLQVAFNYPTSIDGIAFYKETLATPSIQVTDLSTDTNLTSHYTAGTFTSSATGIATIDGSTGTVTTLTQKGTTTITANLTSDTPETYPHLTGITTNLYVIDGSWDLTGFTSGEANTLSAEWTLNTYRKERSTATFQPILTTNGSYFSRTAGLQTSGSVRYYYQSPSHIVLPKATSAKLRFPVRAGMTVTINAKALAEEEFGITNVTDHDGEYTDGFYATPERKDFKFLAIEDGYVTISASGQDLYIYNINVSADMAFADGNEVFLTSDKTNYKNNIKNQGTTNITYTLTDDGNITTGFNTSTGTISGFSGYGTVTVSATGRGTGLLANTTQYYTIHVVDMDIIESSINQEIGTGGTVTISNLKTNVKVVTGRNPETTSSDFQTKVSFTVEDISKPTTRALIRYNADGTYDLTVIGTGDITIKATLGLIEQTYTYVITGPEFKNYMAVTTNDVDTYTMKLDDTSGATDITYSINEVKGELNNLSLSIDPSTGEISGIQEAKTNENSGGAIQVIANCTYNGTSHTVYGMLTIAYTAHEWKLDNTPTLTNYPTDWTKVENGSSWVNYYNSVTKGDNALMMAESAGLQTISNVGRLGTATNEAGTSEKGLMVSQGTTLIIPQVKPGRWIDINWIRHNPGQGERFRCTNLLDIDGKEITEILRIGSTAGSGSGYQGTYSFQVKGNPNGEPVDVTITAIDNAWTEIDRIILHDRTDYQSTMYADIHTPYPSTAAPKHYVWDDGERHEARYGHNLFQNSPNAPYTYAVSTDATLDATIEMNGWYSARGAYYEDPVIKYNSGWGKYYITLTSYSSDYKYAVGRRTWTITVGRKPAQTYPYTWDFTKYRSATRANLGDVTWTYNGDEVTVKTDNYNTNDYESYFVDNSQLMSKALNSALPETEGLGFSITDKTNGGMTLDMQSKVSSTGSAASGGETWRKGELSFKGGGTITVPAPGTDGYYIYIKSSVEPNNVSNTTTCDRNDVNNSNGQYCYKIDNKDTDAVITFSSDADIYAIGVTNIFKDLTPMSGTAWATESRDHAIDHSLTGYLTTNPVKAYAIIETEENPSYTTDLKKATVAIKDQRYVVPANTGLVLKQTESLPTLGEGVTTYNVPLFYPAVTTSTTAEDFDKNLMRPNVTATTYSSEQEGFNNNTYVRFILASRYMTWMQTEAAGVTTKTYPSGWQTGSQPVFYKLHIYKSGVAGEDVATLNTLKANKAYLLLPYKQGMNYPLWWGDSNSPAPRRYIAIEGVSDMEELEALEEMEREAGRGDGRIYNLNGQAVGNDEKSLPAGIYVKNGKKFMVK